MTDLQDDLKAYQKMAKELEAGHAGEWVLIHDQSLVGTFSAFEIAAQAAVERFGRGPYLIRQVGAPPIVLSASALYHPV